MEFDRVVEARAALGALAVVDFDGCDRAGLDAAVGQWRTLRGFTDAVDVLIARRARRLAAEGRGETEEGMLAHGGRRSAREARAVAAREKACTAMPVFEQALAAGSVSTGHVDALAAATYGLDDQARAAFAGHAVVLLRQAEWQSVEGFTRECQELVRHVSGDEGESRLARQRRQNRVRRWIDRVTGMHNIHAELDPESGAKAWTAINAVTTTLRQRAHDAEHNTAADADAASEDATSTEASATGVPVADVPVVTGHGDDGAESPTPAESAYSWDWWAAQALLELLSGARTVDPRVPEVAVHIDWVTLVGGLHEHSVCETSDGTLLAPSTVRRLCCGAEIFPVVLGGDGEVLDQGRSCRLANRAQRRALRAMYRTCGYPRCAVEFDRCEIHHVDWWERYGPTDLHNLLPLCSRHHHLVHEGGWTLRLGRGRMITLVRPDGQIHFEGTTVDRTATPPSTPTTPTGPPPPSTRRRPAA